MELEVENDQWVDVKCPALKVEFLTTKRLGTLSSEAIKRALIIGYIKRLKNVEVYNIAVDREVKVIIGIGA